MSSPSWSATRLANSPCPERDDVRETAADRWLARAYARLAPPGRFAAKARRFADRVEAFAAQFVRISDAALA
ncbi:MAG: hypothetical protein ACKN9T_12370 [Candidatus Methylumidiphilus sp.]